MVDMLEVFEGRLQHFELGVSVTSCLDEKKAWWQHEVCESTKRKVEEIWTAEWLKG